MGPAASAEEPPQRLQITPRSLLLAVAILGGGLALMRVVAASHRVIGWMLAAAAIAGLLHPIVSRLSRHVPRFVAVLTVFLVGVGSTALVVYATVDGIARETRNLQEAAPRRAAEIEESKRFGEFAREIHLAERTKRLVDAVPDRLRGGTPAEAIRSNATRGVAYLATAVLTIFFLLHGPRLAAAAARQIDDERRRQRVERVAVEAYRRAFGYAGGTIAMAVVAGVVAYILARVAEVPGAAPLGLWVGLWNVVPLLGAIIGAIPIVVLAGVTSATKAVLLGVAFIAYQVVEALYAQRWLERRTVKLGPFLTVAGGFVGLELYGLGGAVIVVFALAVGVAVADELAPGPA